MDFVPRINGEQLDADHCSITQLHRVHVDSANTAKEGKVCINSVANEQVLDQSKFKAFAGDKLSKTKNGCFFFEGEKTVGYQHICFSHNVLKWAFLVGSSKSGLSSKGLTLLRPHNSGLDQTKLFESICRSQSCPVFWKKQKKLWLKMMQINNFVSISFSSYVLTSIPHHVLAFFIIFWNKWLFKSLSFENYL